MKAMAFCARDGNSSLSKPRFLATFPSLLKEIPNNLKGKSTSSQMWLRRQMSDPFVAKSKKENYRCRSAYKLLEIDDRFQILKPGHIVIDCGAAPGSWSQVAAIKTNANNKLGKADVGTVIGIDMLHIFAVEGVTFLHGDFTSETIQCSLKNLLKDKKVDVVMSDMAPNATGIKGMDHEKIVMLAYKALRFALTFSKDGATFLTKIWDGNNTAGLIQDLHKFYNMVKVMKPEASRGDSAEKFLLARHFKGLSE